MRDDERSLTSDGHAAPWFGKLVLEVAEACGTKVTTVRVLVYARELCDLSRQQVEQAMRAAMRDGSAFFPSLGEIRRQVMPSPDDRALLAWAALDKAAQTVGAHQSLVCEDACAAQALRDVFGSWPAFCATEAGPELALKRQEFMAAYRHARRRPRPDPVRLPGLAEASGKYGAHHHLLVGTVSLAGTVSTVTEQALRQLNGPAPRRQLAEGSSHGEEKGDR